MTSISAASGEEARLRPFVHWYFRAMVRAIVDFPVPAKPLSRSCASHPAVNPDPDDSSRVGSKDEEAHSSIYVR
jgi:hypothetical protein